jgi:hypothetical protein
MAQRIFILLLMLSACGCQSDGGAFYAPPRIRPLEWLGNQLFSTHCMAREVPPGSKYIDYDHGGGWVELGADGKTHPIPAPQSEIAGKAGAATEL